LHERAERFIVVEVSGLVDDPGALLIHAASEGGSGSIPATNGELGRPSPLSFRAHWDLGPVIVAPYRRVLPHGCRHDVESIQKIQTE